MKRVNVMTLEEYKSQCKAIREKTENFIGTQEEAIKILEDLATKYPEVHEFNTKAQECKNVTEFKQLADSFGMMFSSEDSAEKLYSSLHIEDGMELSDELLEHVTGGCVILILLVAGISAASASDDSGGGAPLDTFKKPQKPTRRDSLKPTTDPGPAPDYSTIVKAWKQYLKKDGDG